MTIIFSARPSETIEADWLLCVTTSDEGLASRLPFADLSLHRPISGLVDRGDFGGRENEVTLLLQRDEIAASNLMLVGCGAARDLHISIVRKALLTALRKICSKEQQSIVVCFDSAVLERVEPTLLVSTLADAITSAPTDADVHRREKKHFTLQQSVICGPGETDELKAAVADGIKIGNVVNLTKNLVNQCPAAIYPESFCDLVVQQAATAGVACTVLDESALRRERMGAMLAVAQGSDRPPRMLKLEYRGATVDQPILALAGKGVTFDSGGYSLKTTDGMLGMKADMAGAATVVSVILGAAALGLPINLNVYAGLVENMVSGTAYKLGDVLTTRSGITVEVQNTDAEGRLVLADVLSYAVDDGVSEVIDVATLTGACVVALGEDVTGVFSNDDRLADSILGAADQVGESVWRMPMFRHYDDQLKSDVADIRNIGGRWGGAITAAKFLQRFVGDVPWAHLDIAGPSFSSSGTSWRDSGATACLVRSLIARLAAAGK